MHRHSLVRFPDLFVALCGLACAALAWAAPAGAQTTTGVLFGIVRDAGGAVMPGVTVTVIDAGTNARNETVTDQRGAFMVPQLPPGTYRVEAALQGFKSFIRSGVPLAVQQQFRLDVVLEIGQMAEAVDVVANASVLDTTTSSVGKVVDNARIQALPLNTRNIYGLIYLTPGVAGGIGKTLSSATVGQVTSQANSPRQLQFGVKALW